MFLTTEYCRINTANSLQFVSLLFQSCCCCFLGGFGGLCVCVCVCVFFFVVFFCFLLLVLFFAAIKLLSQTTKKSGLYDTHLDVITASSPSDTMSSGLKP